MSCSPVAPLVHRSKVTAVRGVVPLTKNVLLKYFQHVLFHANPSYFSMFFSHKELNLDAFFFQILCQSRGHANYFKGGLQFEEALRRRAAMLVYPLPV